MDQMFCFQCEQTAKCEACRAGGVCGKTAAVANLQDALISELVALSLAAEKKAAENTCADLVADGLFMTVTNVNFDDGRIRGQIDKTRERREKIAADSRGFEISDVWQSGEDIRSLKSLILFGLKGMAAYAHHAAALGTRDKTVDFFFIKALAAIGREESAEKLLALALELGKVNLVCMKLLDAANTGTFGTPLPTRVECSVEKGPFIIVTGHDLLDLKLLLEQTKDKGVNVYTHGEMLPAHGYPLLKAYPNLKGNFGTAWQNQRNEFDGVPAPVLFTTNCLMPPKESYADRVFTTSVVGYPEMKHIGAKKDFSEVIQRAVELGGYAQRRHMTGINGGDVLTTGFGHGAVLGAAETVVDAVKSGEIKHFFLVGGCDGARPGRNYYTEFVKNTPADTMILTLACGKYRFNDLNLGSIRGLPRILDVGQCNDAYGAIRIALKLAEAFDCAVNDLPLTLVLSWYEQKAVCILLTLLSLGIKNIYLGPTLPAFLSPAVLKTLVQTYDLHPIGTPEEDLKQILKQA